MIKKIINKVILLYLKKKALIGDNVLVDLNSKIYLKEGSKIKDIVICSNTMFRGEIRSESGGAVYFGEFSSIRPKSRINCVNSIKIGRYVIISQNVTISDNNNHPVEPSKRIKMIKSGWSSRLWKWGNASSSSIIIEDNVWIGQSCLILKGVTIGENSIVAANSVVTKSIPKNSIAAGNPAEVKRYLS